MDCLINKYIIFAKTFQFMKIYKELYKKLLDFICDETELSIDEINKSRREECVQARIVITIVMLESGLTESEIVNITGFTQQQINRNKNTHELICKHSVSLRLLTQITRKYIRKIVEDYKVDLYK